MYCCQQRSSYYLLFLLFLSISMGCTKNKESSVIPQDNLLTLTNSNIRLFNISQRDLSAVVNNIVLAMPKRIITDEQQTSVIGKQLFPEGVWKNGTSFSIPTALLDKSGAAFLSVPLVNSEITFKDTLITNDPAYPRDFYLLPTGQITSFPRNNTPPANPEHFKIRIVNLGDPHSAFNVGGPVSLTFADGSEVDPLLNGVASGAASGYVEIPYGAYQFKLFAGGTPDFKRQLVTGKMVPAFNACIPGALPQEGFMPPVVTFKPGGVYTMMVVNGMFTFDYNCTGTASRESRRANAYQLITDLDPGVNLSYARLNAVNTIPGKKITIRVDGRPLGEPLDYVGNIFREKAIPAKYYTVIQGHHTIEALDAAGNTLATTTLQLYPFDNYTIWAYAGKEGGTQLVFTANDMTNTLYKTGVDPSGSLGPDDGTDGERRRFRIPYAWQSRCMNFCNEYTAITFTHNGQLFLPEYVYPDTLRFPSAYRNLAPGVVPLKNGSIMYRLENIQGYKADGTPDHGLSNDEYAYFPQKIWVNNTAGGQSPGILLTHITPITAANTFIANDRMYSGSYTRPPAENGIYTMALVGGQAGTNPKLIVIKHNK
ncbi:hypothetical protein [Chitinophaga nivalis]|uniref:DUF4397 domain-containing protein n=1 Tax=Chitinophaga nivalis TaxID=2991709 RepID=A0ABT3IJY8_9BACT|nr:hypothetical protein [Chitinophaga nivalis]MCW3466073.1 hypothetical protein [Chitinophaga nivalis]MCW3484236.1 hypothetical protein [Chitinophaga nivalis]